MRLTTTLIFIASVALPGTVLAQDIEAKREGLQITVGTGIIAAPTYLGDDDYQTSVFPNITLRYGERFTASLRGLEFAAISSSGWRAGPVLRYDFGRDERPDDSPFVIADDPTTDLVGLGDIDGTVELGGFVEYEARSFAAKLELRQGVDGGHDGLLGEASLSYRGQFAAIGRQAFYSVGPAISFGDDAYNDTFFGVSAVQSTASGISQFDADGGVNSIGLHSSAMMSLTEKTSLVGFLKYDQLVGDVGDSSIVTERGSKDQVTAGLFINYTF